MRIATLTHCEIHVVTHLGIYDGNAKHTGEFWVRTLEGKFVTRDGLTRADQDATTWFTAYADAFKAASLVGSQQAGQISVELDLSGVHSDYARGCAESSVNNAVAALQPLGK